MQATIIAILAAVVVSYGLGSVWYLWLGSSWRAAVGWSEAGPAYRPSGFELGVGLVGQAVMAVALAVVLGQLGVRGVAAGAVAGGLLWLGFILPSLATNVVFQRRNRTLIWQDGLHWLLILASQGAVLGAFA